MKLVPLNNGQHAQVDDYDYKSLMRWRWYMWQRHKHTSSYAIANINGKRISMHRLILGLTDPKIVTDHIDHNGLNNQKNNLRVCTIENNNKNKVKAQKASSKYLGVYFKKIRRKGIYFKDQSKQNNWEAAIWSKKRIYLGSFRTQEDAALAYNEAAIKYHGEFANLNIID